MIRVSCEACTGLLAGESDPSDCRGLSAGDSDDSDGEVSSCGEIGEELGVGLTDAAAFDMPAWLLGVRVCVRFLFLFSLLVSGFDFST